MEKIKDSYNLNALSQAAGEAAVRNCAAYEEGIKAIIEEREFLTKELVRLGFDVPQSQANFVFAIHPDAKKLYLGLKEKNIFVRYFETPRLRNGIRITIGTRDQLEALIKQIKAILAPE